MLLQVTATGYYLIGSIIVFSILFVGFFIFFTNVLQKQNKMKLKEEQLKHTFSQNLLQTQLEIQEQTLKTISQEIHDNIGQVLSLAKLNLNTIDISRQEQLLQKIDSSKQLVGKAIQDLRDLSKSLNTDTVAANGLIRSLEYELDMIKKAGEHETILDINGGIVKADPQKELILFRIIQEVLNNIIKHAEAKRINVLANYTTDELELIISDDGKGFDLKPVAKEEIQQTPPGLGIRNMHSRAKLIGADFSMNSVTGQGTTVKLKLPLNS